jgi:hypothetical protein
MSLNIERRDFSHARFLGARINMQRKCECGSILDWTRLSYDRPFDRGTVDLTRPTSGDFMPKCRTHRLEWTPFTGWRTGRSELLGRDTVFGIRVVFGEKLNGL